MPREEDILAGDVIEIPLFPLNLVLFPGMVQPLHVFEPRYREMTRFCLDTNVSFGITLVAPDDEGELAHPARFGTLARIADYQRLPDGRYNLITVGAQRFEILETSSDKPYHCAKARLLPESVGEDANNDLTLEARDLLEDYLSLVLSTMEGGETSIPIPTDGVELSYFIAVCLPCDDQVKQMLLETPSAMERLSRERELLRQEIAAISAQILNDGGKGCDETTHDLGRSALN